MPPDPVLQDTHDHKIIPENNEMIFIVLKMEIPIRGRKGIAPSFLIYRDRMIPLELAPCLFRPVAATSQGQSLGRSR